MSNRNNILKANILITSSYIYCIVGSQYHFSIVIVLLLYSLYCIAIFIVFTTLYNSIHCIDCIVLLLSYCCSYVSPVIGDGESTVMG